MNHLLLQVGGELTRAIAKVEEAPQEFPWQLYVAGGFLIVAVICAIAAFKLSKNQTIPLEVESVKPGVPVITEEVVDTIEEAIDEQPEVVEDIEEL